MYTLARLLGESLPTDHCKQTNGMQMAQAALAKKTCTNVLDVGCGKGNSADLFSKWCPGIKWVGVAIEDSPEVRSRRRRDLEFHSFDGQSLPFADFSFDLVYSSQVLEHVRHPTLLMGDMVRVLKLGGLLVGSTSHLEPYHSYSFWNYTPYGFKTMAEEAGLVVSEIRPSIDAFTLILRRLLGVPQFMNRWWSSESPLNVLINLRKRIRGSDEMANATKLLFCAQFSFLCRKN